MRMLFFIPRFNLLTSFVLSIVLLIPAAAQDVQKQKPLLIEKQGSFAVGGTVITNPGTLDPYNPTPSGQTFHGDHAYVFYQIPVNARKFPLVMWRGLATVIKNQNIKAIVSYEPGSGFLFPEGEVPAPIPMAGGTLAAFGVPLSDFMKLTRIPIIIYYGDFIPEKPIDNPGQDGWWDRLEMARLWRPPQPAPSWEGVRDASKFGATCAAAGWGAAAGSIQEGYSEDCLFLNIWRPAGAANNAKLPVMVWIHGGAFVGGSGNTSGDEFAKQGVILITINYRLGRVGHFAFPALSREHPEEPKGSYAFMDQIAALKWVQQNITAFGGDPAYIFFSLTYLLP